jgi:hypothetical protein
MSAGLLMIQVLVGAFSGALFVMGAQALPGLLDTQDRFICKRQSNLPAISMERQLHCAKVLSQSPR